MSHPAALSVREYQILSAYAEYESMKLTAEELGLAYQTIKNHLQIIYRKLDTTNAIGAFKAMGWLEGPR